MPMMGRGSDTRMYSPRSESANMYSSANEDETKQPQYFDDTKPYGNTTTTKKGVNNAK